jgi:trehalose utilization protein
MRLLLFLFACMALNCRGLVAAPVHVLVWDERQPRQEEAYENFLGNEIAKQLTSSDSDLELRSVALDDPEQGLSQDNLEWADVLIWWGHARNKDVTEERAKRVMDRLLAGNLDLIALHSAHWARPFVEAMNWRSVEDAKKHFATTLPGRIVTFTTVAPPKPYTVPAHGSVLTPAWFAWKKNQTNYEAAIHLPWCCFPDYRPDGAPGTLTVKSPDHPIAAGLPAKIVVPQTEMYNEPFHVPEPDEVIFEETWELGEHFRSGMIWNIGKGKVFYFRPGHEQYPVFKQPEMIQILTNACVWLGTE